MEFAFRMPKFPVLVDACSALLCARTPTELRDKISCLSISDEATCWVIDATAEVFAFRPSTKLVMPSLAQRRRTKTQLIALYNARRLPGQKEYTNASLGSKRVERVAADLVSLLAGHSGA